MNHYSSGMNQINKLICAIIFAGVLIIGAISCKTVPEPEISLQDVSFIILPHIEKRDSKYFLVYQIERKERNTLLRTVDFKIANGKAFYFFGIPISHIEFGNIKERSVDEDGLTKFAETDSIFWFNKDQSELKLEIRGK